MNPTLPTLPAGQNELREQITKALVAGICTLWDDSQEAEEAWKVARAAMNDGWPLIEAALEAKDREIERYGVAYDKLVALLGELTEECPKLSTGAHCFYCEWYWPEGLQRHAADCPWDAAKNFLESKP